MDFIFKITAIFNRPTLIEQAPIIYTTILSKYAINKSYNFIMERDGEEWFNCTIYYISNKFNKKYLHLAYKIKYEIADIKMSDDVSGKGNMKLLPSLEGNIFAWTLESNVICRHLLAKHGFKEIELCDELVQFYYKANPWINCKIIGAVKIS